MRRIVAACVRNTVFTSILMLLVFVGGGFAALLMVRERFPDFAIDMVTVTVPYPGADPEEVEEAICTKIEEAVNGLEGIKKYTTRSHEGHGTAFIEIRENYDLDTVKEAIANRVDTISSFPPAAERPIITKATLNLELISVALTGALNERRLKEWAYEVKRELQALPELSQVQVVGTRDYEIAVEVSEEHLREYGLTLEHVANAVRSDSQNLAGGTLRTEGEEIRLRTVGRKYWGEEFENLVVMAGPRGEIVTLGQLATVKDAFTEDRIVSTLNGEPAILVMVYKTSEEDAIAISKAVRAYVASKQDTLPGNLKMSVWDDKSELIRGGINVLTKNSILGLIVVFMLLWMFLDLRLSFWASLGIPISLSGALAIIWLSGNTLNIVSLFGLVMVVGLIVDDAIVVGEAIYVHRGQNDPPLDAAVNGVMEVGVPVLAAVTTTVVAFVPLLFVGGFMGKFIQILPIAVISCLVVSLVECLVMLPSHLSHLPAPTDPEVTKRQTSNPARRFRKGISDALQWFAADVYTPFARRVVARRYLALCVALAVMLACAGLYRGGLVKFIMFPKVDGNIMIARIEFPNGTPLGVTQDAVERVEAALRRVADRTETLSGEPLIKNVYSVTGTTLDLDPGEETPYNTRMGAVKAEILKAEFRGIHYSELLVEWEKEIGAIPGVDSLAFDGDGSGPPGKPIEICLRGDDMDQLLAATSDLSAKLDAFDGVSQVASDYRPGKNEIRFELKPAARALGLTVSDLARQVYAGFYGEEALRLQRGRDDIRVRVRYPSDERSKLSELHDVRIRTPQGTEVPLRSVAELSYGPGYASITRTNGQREVAVSAEINSAKTNAAEIIATLKHGFFDELTARHHGVIVAVQGEQQATSESLSSLYVGFPIALVVIFFIVATIFRSYAQPFIIMFTVPFGVIGAMFGHALMDYPVTMFSVFGIVALAGIVVNDAIVLIDCINTLLARGVPFFEAITRGGARRFRAIFLTTISTCGGLAPMILETDRQTQFVIPMAVSLTFGVAFATLLTLLLIPCLLAILNDVRRLARRMAAGAWPTPEEVEPAARRHSELLDVAKPAADGHASAQG